MPLLLLLLGAVAVAALAASSTGPSGSADAGSSKAGTPCVDLPPIPTTPSGNVVAQVDGIWILDTAGKWWVAFDPKTTIWASIFPSTRLNPFCTSGHDVEVGSVPSPKPNGTPEIQLPFSEACHASITVGHGVWWTSPGQTPLVYFPSFEPHKHEAGFWDDVTEFVGTTVVPSMIKVLAIAEPQIGIAAAAVYAIAVNIAAGRSIGGAVLQSAVDAAKAEAGSAYGGQLLQQGLDKVRALPVGAVDQLKKAEESLAHSGLVSPDQLKAFSTGVIFGQTEQIQKQAIATVRSHLSPSQQTVFDDAIDKGAALTDVTRGLLGNNGLVLVQNAIASAAHVVDPAAAPVAVTHPAPVCSPYVKAPGLAVSPHKLAMYHFGGF